ncbi:polysaccharide deacetylase family protein [Verrucomicrobiota bacterium]
MKRIIRNISLKLFDILGIFKIFSFINRNNLIVLMYHGVTRCNERKGIEDYQRNHIDIKKFHKQMQFLSKKYNIISADDLRHCIINKQHFPKYSLMITIDDGYRNNYTAAFPIFKSFKIPVLIFVPTGFITDACSKPRALWSDRGIYSIAKSKHNLLNLETIDHKEILNIDTEKNKIGADKKLRAMMLYMNNDEREKIIKSIVEQTKIDLNKDVQKYEDYSLLSWGEIKEMNKQNISFGGHTHNHLCLSRLPSDVIKNEIQISNDIFEENLKETPIFFAYPWGGAETFNCTVKNILKDNGCVGAFTTINGFNKLEKEYDFFEIKRMGIEDDMNFLNFKATVTGSAQFLKNLKNKLLRVKSG